MTTAQIENTDAARAASSPWASNTDTWWKNSAVTSAANEEFDARMIQNAPVRLASARLSPITESPGAVAERGDARLAASAVTESSGAVP